MIRYWVTTKHDAILAHLLATLSTQLVTYTNSTSPELLFKLIPPQQYSLVNYEYVTNLAQLNALELNSVVVIENFSGLFAGGGGDDATLSRNVVVFLQRVEARGFDCYLIDSIRNRFVESICDEVRSL